MLEGEGVSPAGLAPSSAQPCAQEFEHKYVAASELLILWLNRSDRMCDTVPTN